MSDDEQALMIDRRAFLSRLAIASALPGLARAQARSERMALYASVGPELMLYDVDVERAALAARGSVTLPAAVQYAWPHLSGRYLYVASSTGGPGAAGDRHYAHAFRIDPASGRLQPHGASISLPSRPIHITTDTPSDHVLIAYNDPSGLTVHRINRDATLGDEVRQAVPPDAGIYAHQTRVSRSNSVAILVARGNNPAGGRPEDPGALKVFNYRNGLLTRETSIAPKGGYGFGPRHLDFHPTQPWVYVSLERQNQLSVFRLDGDTLAPAPLFTRDTLADPRSVGPRQIASTVHVHPNGRFVYVANRADATRDVNGQRVFAGGENTIAVFAINQTSGEPTLVQSADTQGIHPRTFHIDSSGRLLVAAHIMPLQVSDGAGVRTVPASLSVFRISGDGLLEYVRKYDVDAAKATMFWMGMVKLPGLT